MEKREEEKSQLGFGPCMSSEKSGWKDHVRDVMELRW